MPLVLHQDDDLLVLNKPAGLLCVPGRGPDKQDCLSARAQAICPDALVVHRLDMATSGLVLMARGAANQRALSMAFAERAVGKRYQAVVSGCPAGGTGRAQHPAADAAQIEAWDTCEAGKLCDPDPDPDATAPPGWQRIDAPLLIDWPNRPRSRVDPLNGKPSSTLWRCLGQAGAVASGGPIRLPPGAQASRLALQPITGRTHQLRLHLQHLGHPILGDALYAEAPEHSWADRLLLHATDLWLRHPRSGQALHLHSACPF